MTSEKWYWDLNHHRVVRGDERGPADNTLGPYDSPAEAANWREKVEARNDAWDDADEEWAGDGDDDDDDIESDEPG